MDAISRETEKSYCEEELEKSETRMGGVVWENVGVSCRHCSASYVRVVLLNGRYFPPKEKIILLMIFLLGKQRDAENIRMAVRFFIMSENCLRAKLEVAVCSNLSGELQTMNLQIK